MTSTHPHRSAARRARRAGLAAALTLSTTALTACGPGWFASIIAPLSPTGSSISAASSTHTHTPTPPTQTPATTCAPEASAPTHDQDVTVQQIKDTGLVPLPAQIEPGHGAFQLSATTAIIAPAELHSEATMLAHALRSATGCALPIRSDGPEEGNIVLRTGQVNGMAQSPEAYSLASTTQGIVITGSAAHGVFNGTQTLLQLLPGFTQLPFPVTTKPTVPAVTITDAPRFAHRGFMLDIARSFVPAQDIKTLIDNMAQYKVNTLHLHLADDQGWRIEITNDGKAADDPIDYSLLTTVGGTGAMLTHERSASKELGRTGFLTQAEYKDIQAYAAERHVELIPEIDVPGHSNAILASIPQLNTPGSSHAGTPEEPTAPQATGGAVGHSYLDPDNPLTMTFVQHVIGQIADMTTSQKFHVGGDESHDFIQRYGAEKYNAVLVDVFDYVRSIGKHPVGWNEAASAGDLLQPGDYIQFWTESIDSTVAAASSKNLKVILSPAGGSYVPQRYNETFPMGPMWGCNNGCNTRVFNSWDPTTIRKEKNVDQQTVDGPVLTEDQVEGVETAVWGEFIRGRDQIQLMLYPRLLSNAEIGWTRKDLRDTDDFVARLSKMGPDFNSRGINFYDDPEVTWDYDLAGVSPTIPVGASSAEVGVLSAPGTILDAAGVHLSQDGTADKDGIAHSTLGDTPTAVSLKWSDGVSEQAQLRPTQPRDMYHAPGLYVINTRRDFPHAGTYTATATIGERSAAITVMVSATAAQPAPLLPAPTDAGPLQISAPAQLQAGAREHVRISGLVPLAFADLYLGDSFVGQVRGDDDGVVDMHVLVPVTAPAGAAALRVEQEGRSAQHSVSVRAAAQNEAS